MENSKVVRYVESERERYYFHYGEGFLWVKLPVGTRVIFPPPPLPPIENIDEAIENALEHPYGCEPLSAQLRRGMKVTIAYDDISLSLPPMQRPDVRQLVMEKVLQKLAEKGIDDIHIIGAIGLHRRMTPAEIRHIVGERIFKAFFPDRLYDHDAEDPENIVHLGKTEMGEDVEINRRAVESDLLIYVNLNLVPMDGGHKALPTGLGTYRSIRHHHNPNVLIDTSLMDPTQSAMHDALARIDRIIQEHVRAFHIETTINNATFPWYLLYLQKTEFEHNLWDRLNFHVSRTVLPLLPISVRRAIFHATRAPYKMTSIQAGSVEEVHRHTLKNVYKQQAVPVEGQCDIMLVGMPYLGPYNVNSILNPILVNALGPGYLFQLFVNKPVVRPGGVMVFTYPLHEDFHPVHQVPHIDFYERVLKRTRDMNEIASYEEEFATNPRYIELYRHSYSFHGAHAPFDWYWGYRAQRYLSKIIVVKPKVKHVAEVLGYEVADSIDEAIEMAKDVVGPDPRITYFHMPPIFVCDVR
ncbi:MAG TPA: DUF2088 domain-containing protein [Armatimonadetes bacterium]|nr:DUF2088 domain-containing protein [Armatimonadota bacterium]